MTERDSNGRFAEGNPGGPGPPAENLNGQKHGLNRLRRTVEELGGRLLDGRSSTVKALNHARATFPLDFAPARTDREVGFATARTPDSGRYAVHLRPIQVAPRP